MADGKETIIVELVKKLEANGLIIHINPLQEWFQPEGDRYYEAPIVTISRLLERTKLNLIVKEVGHGMGPASLQALMQLPIDAIEFAAFGEPTFQSWKCCGIKQEKWPKKQALAYVGHTAVEMVGYVNNILSSQEVLCRNFIISGGISSYLDGAYLIAECHGEAIYGQASGFLKHAMGTYEALRLYTRQQIEGLAMSRQILKIKSLQRMDKTVSGFSKLSKQQKIDWVVAHYCGNDKAVAKVLHQYELDDNQLQKLHDGFSENTIGNF